ncbi:MAG TPA: hypothetical protein VK911_16790, partial [Vicinamibacterales bacterium]|nr:hypothetical protein [Vicinamibacterales bacterium]
EPEDDPVRAERAAGRIIVMPGGGITERTAPKIFAALPITEAHFAALEPQTGRMEYRNPRVFMGGTLRPPEYTLEVTRPEGVARVIKAAGSGVRV